MWARSDSKPAVDDYDRPVGGVNVEAEQARRGLAWVYRKYSDDARLLRILLHRLELLADRHGLDLGILFQGCKVVVLELGREDVGAY